MSTLTRGRRLRIHAIAYRQWLALMREPHNWFDILVWPVLDILLFGAIGVYVLRTSGTSKFFAGMLAGIALWHVIHLSTVSLSKGLLDETWSRTLLNLLVSPVSEIEFFIGVGLFTLVKLALGLSLITTVCAVAFSFNLLSVGLVIIPILGILLLLALSLSIIVSALVARFGYGAEILVWGFAAATLPLSGVFYPINSLPAFVRPIAQALPTSRAFTALRHSIDGGGILWSQIVIGYALGFVFLAAALWFASTMLRIFRNRGYITRFS